MIIYNVTTKVDHRIATVWLKWMREEHMPAIISTGCFTKATILELIEVDTTDGPTYAVQYQAESKSKYNQYIEQFSDEMRKNALEKWGESVISFRSVLQVVY